MQKRVRAIIFVEDTIILIKRVKPGAVYFVFPGGGVETGETLKEALIREIKEELGLVVDVKELFAEESFERDSIQQQESFYRCEVTGGELGTGDGPEYQESEENIGTFEVVSIPIKELSELKVLPVNIKNLVTKKFS